MAATYPDPSVHSITPVSEDVYTQAARGEGWLFFAGSMLGLAGIMRIIDAIWAFGYNGSLPENLKNAVFGDSLTTYGWVWLGVGALMLLCSFLVLVRSQFARWFGIVAAGVGGITAMAWMPYYPVWSLMYVALAVMTFYALTRYGGRETV